MITQKLLTDICTGLRCRMRHQDIVTLLNTTPGTVTHVARKKPARILPLGDMHCGSNVGLTPPAYQYKYIPNPKTEEHRRRNKWAMLQKECWEWYLHTLDMIKPIDKLFLMGDLIDGDGSLSGGTELITTDRNVQICMAIEAIDEIGECGKVMVFGTAYHTGKKEDFESIIADHYHCKIGSHEWEQINGCTFDLKHHQGNTKNPATSLFNEICDNREWAGLGEQPKANVLIRAHSHRLAVFEIEDCLAISLPSLESYGTKFGARRCSRKVQFGMIVLDVWPDGFIEKQIFIAKLAGHITGTN